MEVKLISDWNELSTYINEWKDLAEAALEPNPFYEDWMLLPALRHLGGKSDLHCLLIFHSDSRNSSRLLCGLIPLERQRHYLGLPISAWSVWKYAHCFLTTPLLRKAYAAECLNAFFDWINSSDGNHNLLEWRWLTGDGQFQKLLADQFHRRDIVPLLSELFSRAVFKPAATPDAYLATALSGKSRSSLRRKIALLSESGHVKYIVIQPHENLQPWIDSFLRIEASGWKGQEQSALACRESHKQFFVETVTQAFERKRLIMSALLLDGNPIAQNCYFCSGRGSFFFKPAFDESYSRFSPGLHVECENIRYLHSRPDIDWMDSCTAPTNDMYNRLFVDRRVIQSLLVPPQRYSGRLLVSGISLMKSIKYSLQAMRHRQPNGRSPVAAATQAPEATDQQVLTTNR